MYKLYTVKYCPPVSKWGKSTLTVRAEESNVCYKASESQAERQ